VNFGLSGNLSAVNLTFAVMKSTCKLHVISRNGTFILLAKKSQELKAFKDFIGGFYRTMI